MIRTDYENMRVGDVLIFVRTVIGTGRSAGGATIALMANDMEFALCKNTKWWTRRGESYLMIPHDEWLGYRRRWWRR